MTDTNTTKAGVNWDLRHLMTLQMLYGGLKQLAEQSGCSRMKQTLDQQWFGGLDMEGRRMLTDGRVVEGGASRRDLETQASIVAEVLDGLRQRPRESGGMAKSLYRLTLSQYDLALALCLHYQAVRRALLRDLLDPIDPYEASMLETVAYSLLNVMTEGDTDTLYKPLDDQDYLICPL